jgi:replicative DNA helicase
MICLETRKYGEVKMNEIKVLLRRKGIKFDDKESGLIFEKCPLCGESKTAGLLEKSFWCDACTTEELIPNSPILEKLGISLDTSPTDFAQLFDETKEEIFNPKMAMGISTGYKDLDKIVGGLKKGHLYMLVAETGMGKSVFATNLIVNVINSTNTTCSYLDLENGRHASIKRFIAVKGLLPITSFNDTSTQTKTEKISRTLSEKLIYRDHRKLAEVIESRSGEAMAKVLGELIKYDVSERKTELVVIDPLENFEATETDYNAISKVVIYFKELAQELGISIVILHHLRKPSDYGHKSVKDVFEIQTPKYRIPTIHDILGTSKIANMATDVWALVRQKESTLLTDQGRILLRVLKQREGNLGDVFLVMNLENLRIAEVATEYYGGQTIIEN